MVISSKGKFFNKINIIDLLIIILVIVAILGAYFRFNGKNVVAENESCEFYYTITISEIREENKNLLLQSAENKLPFKLDGKVSSSMGVLVKAEERDSIIPVEKNDGTIVNAVVPEKYDVVLTFKVNGFKSDGGYMTPEMFEICAGKAYSISNIYCLVEGNVDRVWSE